MVVLWCRAVRRPNSSSNDVAGVVVRSWTELSHSAGLCSSSHQSHSPSTCVRDSGHLWLAVRRARHLGLVLNLVEALAAICLLAVNAGSTTHRSSWHFHSSHSYRTSQRIGELLRFTCGQLLLRCQVALVLHEKLVDTVGDTLTRPSLHVAERLLVRDTEDYGVRCLD